MTTVVSLFDSFPIGVSWLAVSPVISSISLASCLIFTLVSITGQGLRLGSFLLMWCEGLCRIFCAFVGLIILLVLMCVVFFHSPSMASRRGLQCQSLSDIAILDSSSLGFFQEGIFGSVAEFVRFSRQLDEFSELGRLIFLH